MASVYSYGKSFVHCKVINNKFINLTYRILGYSLKKIEDLKFYKTNN